MSDYGRQRNAATAGRYAAIGLGAMLLWNRANLEWWHGAILYLGAIYCIQQAAVYWRKP